MAREISPGDQVVLEGDGERNFFIIDYVSATTIYVSPKENPKRQSALIPVNGEWKMQGNDKDKVSFLPRDESAGVLYTVHVKGSDWNNPGEYREESIRGFLSLWDLLEYISNALRAVVAGTSTGENPQLNSFLDDWWEKMGDVPSEVEDYVRQLTFWLRRDYSSNLEGEMETDVLKIETVKMPSVAGSMTKSAGKR